MFEPVIMILGITIMIISMVMLFCIFRQFNVRSLVYRSMVRAFEFVCSVFRPKFPSIKDIESQPYILNLKSEYRTVATQTSDYTSSSSSSSSSSSLSKCPEMQRFNPKFSKNFNDRLYLRYNSDNTHLKDIFQTYVWEIKCDITNADGKSVWKIIKLYPSGYHARLKAESTSHTI